MINLPRVFKPFFLPKRYKIAYGGRGSGKSTSLAIMLLLRGIQTKTRILCAREIQNSITDSVYKLLKDLISENKEFQGYECLQNIIRHPNGTEFIFKGLRHNINDIKSTEGVDICWVEEAQSVSEQSWEILTPTIREANSEIWISFNPNTKEDPTYQRFVLNADDDMLVLKVNFDNNPFFTDVLKSEMERDKARDYNKYLHIWEGEFISTTESAVFKNWKVEEFEAPYQTEFMFGADWGFANDPNTLTRCFIIGKKLFIDYEANGIGIEIDDTPKMWDSVPDSRNYVIRADSARPELISFMNRQGFTVKSASKWQGSVEDGIETIRSFDVVIHPRCKNTIKEFSLYSYKTNRYTGDILPIVEDANNHHIDSIRYLLEPVTRNKISIWEKII